MKLLLSTIVLTLLALPATAQELHTYERSYVNQSGSVMEFNVDATTGEIEGVYISALGCAKDEAYPLTGWLNDKAISFTVNFGTCGSITAWAGHVADNGNIKTIWNLSRSSNAAWDALLTGSSLFKPVLK